MNIMSTLGEEVDKGGEHFNEEDETIFDVSDSSENKVIVRMRDKKSLSRPQSDETSRVRWMECHVLTHFNLKFLGTSYHHSPAERH